MRYKIILAVLLLFALQTQAGTISYVKNPGPGYTLSGDFGFLLPERYTEVKACVISWRLGGDIYQSDTSPSNNGICVRLETSPEGTSVFRILDAVPNDNLPKDDLFNNDEVRLVFVGLDYGQPIQYDGAIQDLLFSEGPGVILNEEGNSLQYGGYRQPTIRLFGNRIDILFNADGMAPVNGNVSAARSYVQHVNLVIFEYQSVNIITGYVGKSGNDFYASIPYVPVGQNKCGFLSVEIPGQGLYYTQLSGEFNARPGKGVWLLEGLENSDGEICF